MAKYVLKGSKQRGETVGKLRVDDERTMVLDGEPVELTEEEHKNLSQSYNLRKAPDDDSDTNPTGKSEGHTEDEKGGDN